MNAAQAHKQAAKTSKTSGAQFVVYVFDEGQNVYNAAQCAQWASLILVEACYVGGVLVASTEVA